VTHSLCDSQRSHNPDCVVKKFNVYKDNNHDISPDNVHAKCNILLDHNYTSDNRTLSPLRIGCINVCGLLAKSKFLEFDEFVNDYDIVVCTETKTIDYKSVLVEAYDIIYKSDDNACKSSRYSGVCFFIKDHLKDYVKEISISDVNNAPNYIFWCIIGNILFGAVYIPHEKSVYANVDLFEQIHSELITICNHYNICSVCLAGDFNSRTAELPDYTPVNDFIIENVANDAVNAELLTPDQEIYQQRVSDDKKTNNYGYHLLSLCNSTNLRIVNGRYGAESKVPTCKDSSVVDYFLVSTDILDEILKLKVEPFDPILSDIHCALSLNLHSTILANRNCTNDANIRDKISEEQAETSDVKFCSERTRWKGEFVDMFKENINLDRINTVINMLDDFEGNDIDSTDKLNKINDELILALKESADISGMLKTMECTPTNKKENKQSQKWFNKECYRTRKDYHRCKSVYRRNRNVNNLRELKNKSKSYKKCVNKSINQYQKNFNKKVRSLKASNPKEFWKLLCTNDKKRITEKIQISVFSEYFKKLNTDNNVYETEDFKDVEWDNHLENSFINADFTDEEIKSVVKTLKNNKSPGEDLIINEFIKCTIDIMCPVYRKLFNIVLKSGIIPESWTKGIIIPIFKKKGDIKDPSNYRGITLLSCIGKVFTSLISRRLNKYVENFELLGEEQAGFRKNHSTVDHLLVLYGLIDIYVKKEKKKLFCTFVDYSKAFDTVPHIHLWTKLLSTGINGKIFNVVKSMYKTAKSYIKHENYTGFTFNCEIGVRQGENLSPLLFALYLNDLEDFLAKAYNGLDRFNALIQEYNQTEDIMVYLKLFTILYADDTIILAESSDEMQAALNGLFHYCQLWKLKINTSKTKTVIFGAKMYKTKTQFKIGDMSLNIVSEYD
jgi:hypothetical protein